MISVLLSVVFIVSSWLAHMSPSSPVSVGTFPSNRTLLVGAVQVLEGIKFEHLPLVDDPFTATKSVSLGRKYCTGKTAIIL